ncbi:MAG: Trp family transcriptional regulator [Candidatus Paceibacterota bacterium]
MKKIKKYIIKTIIDIGNNPVLLDAFLTDLLTPAEYIEIKKRWEIVKMLDKGVNQHEIAEKLHVGIATVTRGSRALRDSKGGFKRVLKNHSN